MWTEGSRPRTDPTCHGSQELRARMASLQALAIFFFFLVYGGNNFLSTEYSPRIIFDSGIMEILPSFFASLLPSLLPSFFPFFPPSTPFPSFHLFLKHHLHARHYINLQGYRDKLFQLFNEHILLANIVLESR